MVFIKSKPDSKAVLTVSQILIICMPALFLAFNYMLYGRLLSMCIGDKYAIIRGKWITMVFVGFDISTFIIQVKFPTLLRLPDVVLTSFE